MDPVQMLTEDHQKVRALFGKFESAKSPREEQQIAQTVFTELQVHSALEKEMFYPAMRQAGNQDDKDLVEHSYHDHAEAEALIARLKEMQATDVQFGATFRKLRDAVLEHAQEEEEQMFPDAEKFIGAERLPQLGQQMQERRQQLMGSLGQAAA